MNVFERPSFVRKVRATGEKLGYPKVFERWLRQAAAGQWSAILSLKDYGLVPHTKEEMREFLAEYVSNFAPVTSGIDVCSHCANSLQGH